MEEREQPRWRGFDCPPEVNLEDGVMEQIEGINWELGEIKGFMKEIRDMMRERFEWEKEKDRKQRKKKRKVMEMEQVPDKTGPVEEGIEAMEIEE